MYTIKEVADKVDVCEHTIRFWAKNNFFPSITRDKNNIRKFDEKDIEWVRIVKCLRSVGTDNKSIKKYIDLCLIGDSTIPERYEIIRETKKKAQEQMQEIKQQMELLDYKESYYQDLIKNNESDKWNPLNKKEEAEAVC